MKRYRYPGDDYYKLFINNNNISFRLTSDLNSSPDVHAKFSINTGVIGYEIFIYFVDFEKAIDRVDWPFDHTKEVQKDFPNADLYH